MHWNDEMILKKNKKKYTQPPVGHLHLPNSLLSALGPIHLSQLTIPSDSSLPSHPAPLFLPSPAGRALSPREGGEATQFSQVRERETQSRGRGTPQTDYGPLR